MKYSYLINRLYKLNSSNRLVYFLSPDCQSCLQLGPGQPLVLLGLPSSSGAGRHGDGDGDDDGDGDGDGDGEEGSDYIALLPCSGKCSGIGGIIRTL